MFTVAKQVWWHEVVLVELQLQNMNSDRKTFFWAHSLDRQQASNDFCNRFLRY